MQCVQLEGSKINHQASKCLLNHMSIMQVLHIRGISGMGLQCLYQIASCYTMYNLEHDKWERTYHELPDPKRQAVQHVSGAPDR